MRPGAVLAVECFQCEPHEANLLRRLRSLARAEPKTLVTLDLEQYAIVEIATRRVEYLGKRQPVDTPLEKA